jgi:rhodanese-related sulfurtransferase
MKRIIHTLSVLFFLFFVVSCGKPELKIYNSTSDMVADAKSNVEMISAEDLKNVIENEEHFYLVDCRETVDYDSSSIVGAINIPRGLIEFQIGNKVPERRANVYVFCNNTDKSVLVADVLPSMKFPNVKVLEGGFDAWKVKYPDLVEFEHANAATESHAPAASSGGCGG